MNKADLQQFTGTEAYHRWSILFPRFVLTDGAKYVADEAGAYWLMDAIASHINAYYTETFALARLVVKDSKAVLTIEDGNDGVLAKQDIEYTDFPLGEVKLYMQPQDDLWVIMLPSEY